MEKGFVINYPLPTNSMNIYPFKAFKISNRKFSQFPHSHSYLQIWYVKYGSCIHWLNDKEYNLEKGDIFVLPPDVPHRVISEDANSTELLGCEFMEEFICGENKNDSILYYDYIKPFMVPANEVKPFISLDGVVVKEVESIFEGMVKEYDVKKPLFELGMRASFLKLLSIIISSCENSKTSDESGIAGKHKKAIKDALSYMNEHFEEKIYLNDVCKLMFMSPTYFSSVFKQVTGKTFTEQLNFIRIQKAKDLLMDHSKTVGRIASEVGFTDSAYFDRVFKKEVGVSPGKFRKYL